MVQTRNHFLLAVSFCIICFWMTVNGKFLQVHKVHHSPGSRIIGGNPKVIPYYVRINITIAGVNGPCGGSLISDRHVLTAAHCLNYVSLISKIEKLQFGPHKNDNEDEEAFSFETSDVSFVIHPQYNPEEFTHDLAIIKLSTPLNMSLPHVELAKLPNEKDADRSYAGETVEVYGMGQTSDDFRSPPAKELMGVNMTALDHDTCYALIRKLVKKPLLYDYEICTKTIDSSRTPRSACHGDSGGPLACNGTLIGVTSRVVVGLCTQGEPNIYVGVGPHLQWIKQQINAS